MVEKVNPTTFSMDEEISRFLKLTKELAQFTLLDDRMVYIDGYPAHWITRRDDSIMIPGKSAIDETIFLLAADRYYSFSLTVPTAERDGEFARGFRDLVASVRIIH